MTFDALLDDAAIFPPGNLPLAEAVQAHLAHGVADHAGLVGPLVVALADLPALAETTADLPAGTLALSVTVPSPAAAGEALDGARRVRAARLVGLEVAVPEGVAATDVVPTLDAGLRAAAGVSVWVELPRDDRREPLLAELAGTSYAAKLRTGGVRADLHPDEDELAAAIVAIVRAGVPFKATAGLHQAVRNTAADTGFEQHGFLNLLAATDAALGGADEAQVRAWLAERDADRLAARVAELSPAARETFRSFGTCSIAEPVEELAALGLLPPSVEEAAHPLVEEAGHSVGRGGRPRPSRDPRNPHAELTR
ncbi:MAG TPA: hypothetical protein VNS81_07390 [Nocardioides sp.]|nr:hypothetical protein [Nocardioides sp.]